MTAMLVCFYFLFNDDCLSSPVSEFPFRQGKDFPEEDTEMMITVKGFVKKMLPRRTKKKKG